METRKQMLQSTYRRHKFEVDSKEILNRLEEKEKSLQDSKDPNQLIFEIETLKDKVSFFYEMSLFWVRSGLGLVKTGSGWLQNRQERTELFFNRVRSS